MDIINTYETGSIGWGTKGYIFMFWKPLLRWHIVNIEKLLADWVRLILKHARFGNIRAHIIKGKAPITLFFLKFIPIHNEKFVCSLSTASSCFHSNLCCHNRCLTRAPWVKICNSCYPLLNSFLHGLFLFLLEYLIVELSEEKIPCLLLSQDTWGNFWAIHSAISFRPVDSFSC